MAMGASVACPAITQVCNPSKQPMLAVLRSQAPASVSSRKGLAWMRHGTISLSSLLCNELNVHEQVTTRVSYVALRHTGLALFGPASYLMLPLLCLLSGIS